MDRFTTFIIGFIAGITAMAGGVAMADMAIQRREAWRDRDSAEAERNAADEARRAAELKAAEAARPNRVPA